MEDFAEYQKYQVATNNHIALPLAEIQHGLRECANENGHKPRRSFSCCSWCSSCSSCSCISRCSRCFGFNCLSMISLAANICCSRLSLFLPAAPLRSTNGFCFRLSLFLPAAHLRSTNDFCFRLSLHIHPYSSTYSSNHNTLHIHSLMPHFHWWQKPPPAAPGLVFCNAIKAALAFPCIFIHIHPHKHPSSNALKAACS